jgi:SSS family solute:Na+ symporter
VFLAAVFFQRPDPRAAKIALVFGAALYAWFTFGWTPLHYLHLMFITLFSALGLMWVLGRTLPSTSTRRATAGPST